VKLKASEETSQKAEKDAAAVEDLRQRLKNTEDALSNKETQQIERENAIVERFETQNRRFLSKPYFHLPSAFVCCLFIFSADELLLFLQQGRWVSIML
jgi:hypothetical protein